MGDVIGRDVEKLLDNLEKNIIREDKTIFKNLKKKNYSTKVQQSERGTKTEKDEQD